MTEPLWQLDGVGLSGRGGDQPRLSYLSLSIGPGVTAVMGASGAGKTSLLNLLVGFEKPDAGRIHTHITPAGDQLPLFWAPHDGGLWPHMTVREHLETVMPPGRPDPAQLLQAMQLADIADRYPAKVSQGQRSRLAVARALAAHPAVLVMDEPMVHVDPASVSDYWQVIAQHVQDTGASLLFATHSPQAALAHADRAILLDQGRLLDEGPVMQLYRHPRTEHHMHFWGEGNWIDADQARQWLNEDASEHPCYRPEQIAIIADDASPIVVQSSRFAGSVATVNLHHEQHGLTRRFYHRPASNGLPQGARVVLRVLTVLALAVLLTGCGDADAKLSPSVLKYWQMPPAGATLPQPRSVNIGPDDQVLVLDKVGRLLMFDPTGKLIRQWRMPDIEAGKPEDACWLADGRIAVADTHYHRVLFFDQHGERRGTMGGPTVTGEPGKFYWPVSVVQDDDENLYVSQYGNNTDRVQKFSRDGTFITSFASAGTEPGQFQRAAGMAWHRGNVYVADAGNGRVQVFHDDGRFSHVLGNHEFYFPYDVAIAGDQSVYVIEWGAGRVTRLDLAGNLLGRFGRAGTGEGEFRTPWSIAVDSKLRLRVADTENRRIVEMIF